MSCFLVIDLDRLEILSSYNLIRNSYELCFFFSNRSRATRKELHSCSSVSKSIYCIFMEDKTFFFFSKNGGKNIGQLISWWKEIFYGGGETFLFTYTCFTNKCSLEWVLGNKLIPTMSLLEVIFPNTNRCCLG